MADPAAETKPTSPPPTPHQSWAKAGQDGLGANLDAPADRLTQGYPARPEWYFLFLVQLLKYFEGEQEIIGTVIIPGAVGALLFMLPLFGAGKLRKFGHAVGILVVVGVLSAVGMLTVLAIADDSPDPLPLGIGGAHTRREQVLLAEAAGDPSHSGGALLFSSPDRGPDAVAVERRH